MWECIRVNHPALDALNFIYLDQPPIKHFKESSKTPDNCQIKAKILYICSILPVSRSQPKSGHWKARIHNEMSDICNNSCNPWGRVSHRKEIVRFNILRSPWWMPYRLSQHWSRRLDGFFFQQRFNLLCPGESPIERIFWNRVQECVRINSQGLAGLTPLVKTSMSRGQRKVFTRPQE